jgi:hypothetical protein
LHLCKPVDMSQEWGIATGGNNIAKTSCDLPAFRTNRLHHTPSGNDDLNLFSRMPLPPKDICHLVPETPSTTLFRGGRTTDHVRLSHIVLEEGAQSAHPNELW